LLLEGVSIPVRFRPNAAARVSMAEPSNLAKASVRSDGSGCQATTKSPPDPNLQSGSACLFLFGFIIISGFQKFFKFVRSQMFYRQGMTIYPNKNRTKMSRINTFFSPSDFYYDSL
jgi:hypothetical protein